MNNPRFDLRYSGFKGKKKNPPKLKQILEEYI